ncbi:MAG: hypothetical protein AEth_00654 [Candidatus Argoarchaeum ethanivorans]|uniref:Uncharacterized protein n=1 Tax=Candidatus Argoarchaeum ethanivorans TaxID=2608793 RepID=A0A8B3S2N0_9EURY|nr:MAG: hypothetical protein AEth_00654 [Candidatus Argoarchaeum ethanivorans]
MVRQKSKQKDKQHKSSRILAAILFMFLTFTAAGCISNNEQIDAATAGEANAPPVVNKTKTPEPEPTETGSNVNFVTPTPTPEPTPIPEGTMLVSLDIPVILYGADPEDIEMSLYYTGHSIKGDVKVKSFPQKDNHIFLGFARNDSALFEIHGHEPFGVDYGGINNLSFEFPTSENLSCIRNHVTAIVEVRPWDEISQQIQ